MTTKADFNAEEWSVVLEGPPMAALMVIGAERGGTIRESMSIARAYTEARRQSQGGELLDEIVSAAPQVDPSRFAPGQDPSEEAERRLKGALAALERHADPGEVEAYKGFVRELAETVAAAHKEGGVLGIGGKPISDGERAALDRIGATLEGR